MKFFRKQSYRVFVFYGEKWSLFQKQNTSIVNPSNEQILLMTLWNKEFPYCERDQNDGFHEYLEVKTNIR